MAARAFYVYTEGRGDSGSGDTSMLEVAENKGSMRGCSGSGDGQRAVIWGPIPHPRKGIGFPEWKWAAYQSMTMWPVMR